MTPTASCPGDRGMWAHNLRLTGPDVHLATVYTCESGDSIATRKKYLCSREEMEAQKEKSK